MWPPHSRSSVPHTHTRTRTLTRGRKVRSLAGGGGGLLMEFSWENLTVFPLGSGTPHLQDLHLRSSGVNSISPEEHRTALGVTSRTLARPTSTHNRVGNLPQQSDVCDVTFPKNDCCSLSPYNTLACAHSFPIFFFRRALFCSIRTALATTTRTFRNFLQNLVSFLPYFYPLSPNQTISMNLCSVPDVSNGEMSYPGEILRRAIDYRSSGDRVPKRVVVSLPQCTGGRQNGKISV